MTENLMNPREIPDDLINRAARAMCGFNDIMRGNGRQWDAVVDPERGHWIELAKASLIAISPKISVCAQTTPDVDQWITYADKLEKVLEIVAESSTDELKRIQAKEGLRLVRPQPRLVEHG